MLNINNTLSADAQKALRVTSAIVKDLGGKAGKAGLRNIGRVLAADVRQNVNRASGNLAKSLTTKVMTKKVKGIVGIASGDTAVEVGAFRKVLDRSGKKRAQHHIFRFYEHGTGRHMIRAYGVGNKRIPTKRLRRYNASGTVLPRSVLHPGQRGRQLLPQALRRHEGRADALFMQGAGKLLRKHGVRP